jgi:hypothetical protein
MRKTANKIRRETKVIVSTETEETFTQENSSEISNPNNEIALTYVYSKMQHQYEVFTYLAEVDLVIFVAEPMPTPPEINDAWVRRYDWIIARVLKDEGFRATLNDLIQDLDETDPVADQTQNPFAMMQKQAEDRFASFAQSGNQGNPPNQGLSIPDIYAEPQRVYEQYLKDRATRDRANALRDLRRERLLQHIRDNILYYCRAIWSEEDADHRLLRYKKENRRLPLVWEGATGDPQDLLAHPTAFSPWFGAPLLNWIDPTGPIGFHGNYAVFELRPVSEEEAAGLISNDDHARAIQIDNSYLFSITDLLAVMAGPYVDGFGNLEDPALRALRDPTNPRAPFVLDPTALTAPSDELVGDIISYLPRLQGDPDIHPSAIADLQGNPIRDPADAAHRRLLHPISTDDFGEYLYRKNGTRRFLIDSNNLQVDISVGNGAALEPFKRAHRFLDVLGAYEGVIASRLKNIRRENLVDDPREFDPDLAKVVIIGGGSAASVAASEAALLEARGGLARPDMEPATAGETTAANT